MAISKYDNPALQPVRDLTPVTAQLPFEALYNQLQQKQAAHDKGKADVTKTKDGLYAATNSLQVDDPTRIEIINNYTKKIDSAVESLGGDFSNADTVLDPLKSEIVRDVTGGMLGKQQMSLATAQEDAKTYAKEADKIGSTNKEFGDIGFQVFNSTGGTIQLNNGSFSTYTGAAYKNDVSQETAKAQDDLISGWSASSFKKDTVSGGWINRTSGEQITEKELLPNVQTVVYRDAEYQEQVKRDAVVANKTFHINKGIVARANQALNVGVLTDNQRSEITKNKGIAESQLSLYTRENKNNLITQMNAGIEASKQAITDRLASLGSAKPAEKEKINGEIIELNNQIRAYADAINNADSLTADDFANAIDATYVQNANNARVKLLVDKYSFVKTEELKRANPYALIAAHTKATEEKPVHDRIVEINLATELTSKVTIADLEDNKNNLAQRQRNLQTPDYINRTFYNEHSPNSDRRAEVTEAITKGDVAEMNRLYDELKDNSAYSADIRALAGATAEMNQNKELAYTVEQQKTLFNQHVKTPTWQNDVNKIMNSNSSFTGFSTKAVIPIKGGKTASLETIMRGYLLEGLSPEAAVAKLKAETGVSGGVQAGGDRDFSYYKEEEKTTGADSILDEYTKVYNILLKETKPLVSSSQVISFHSDNINNVLSIPQGGLQSQALFNTLDNKSIDMKYNKLLNQSLTGEMGPNGEWVYSVKIQKGTGQNATTETHLVKNTVENADNLFPRIGAASAMENRKTVSKAMTGFSSTDLYRLDATIQATGDKAAYQMIGQPGFKQALTSNGVVIHTPEGRDRVIKAVATSGDLKVYDVYVDDKFIMSGAEGPQIARLLGAYMYNYTKPATKGNASSKQGDTSGAGLMFATSENNE